MTETAWKYLEMIWDDDHHGGDTSQARTVINELWPDLEGAAEELVEAYLQVKIAEEDETDRDALISASEGYNVGGLPFHLPAMRQVLSAGLQAIGSPVITLLQKRFKESEDVVQKARIAILLAEFGEAAADCVPLLVAEVANSANPKERFNLRCSAAYALGNLGIASAEAVEVLAQVAGASSEAQPLRSYCIEALMDLGPPAAAAIPILEQILKNEAEDEDLRNFAWSALKSVGASSREHPCGGTWAEHMRSLYRAE
jgi:HEAT repeat protein